MHGFSNSIGMRFCLNSSFHTVLCQDFKSAVSVSVFCCCWNVILDSRLSQDSRRELRRWLTKVLLKCMSVMHLYQSNAVVLFKAVCLAARLVAIPSQVGLDSRSVMMSLHLCSSLVSCSETEVVELGDSIAQLLSAVVRNHTVVAGSCPAPIISTVNSIQPHHSICMTCHRTVEMLFALLLTRILD